MAGMISPAGFLEARAGHGGLAALPSAHGFDLDAAYALEGEIARLHQAAGHTVIGRKVGYANKAMWRMLKLDTLVWAHMFDDTVYMAPQGHFEMPIRHFRSPRIEPEIVVKMSDPSKEGTIGYDWIALGFEILDNPYHDWKFTPVDFVAAWGLHAALIVGPTMFVTESNAETLANQLAEFRVALLRNGELVEEGAGKNSLRSPALCVAELARAAAERGDPLQKGELISTGTLTTAQTIAAGEEWRAELNGLPLASLRVQFT
jgi:2-oxo-3-hexenedioate decarboxylase